jgi:hypothetical protein
MLSNYGNIGIINSTRRSHLVGSFYEIYGGESPMGTTPQRWEDNIDIDLEYI